MQGVKQGWLMCLMLIKSVVQYSWICIFDGITSYLTTELNIDVDETHKITVITWGILPIKIHIQLVHLGQTLSASFRLIMKIVMVCCCDYCNQVS